MIPLWALVLTSIIVTITFIAACKFFYDLGYGHGKDS